ncbi:MAG: hypothetical protein IPM06_18725 [Rhizobiales bacterium]|nr:hypothetical protein [Hyphomicrobiales bacterium]
MGTRAIIIAQCNIDKMWYGRYKQFDGGPMDIGPHLLEYRNSPGEIGAWIVAMLHSKVRFHLLLKGDENAPIIVKDPVDAECIWWNCFYRWDGSQWIYGRPVREGGFGQGERPLSEVMAEINAKQKR